MGESGVERLAVLEPDVVQSGNADLDRAASVVRGFGGDDGNGECAARFQHEAAVAGAGRKEVVDGRVSGVFREIVWLPVVSTLPAAP